MWGSMEAGASDIVPYVTTYFPKEPGDIVPYSTTGVVMYGF
jgi:hypothetical protein